MSQGVVSPIPETIAVVGLGLLGRGIATVFCRTDFASCVATLLRLRTTSAIQRLIAAGTRGVLNGRGFYNYTPERLSNRTNCFTPMHGRLGR